MNALEPFCHKQKGGINLWANNKVVFSDGFELVAQNKKKNNPIVAIDQRRLEYCGYDWY